ncbi:hypothetical protein GTA08_BOTSDO11935 [Neofusicoccum parvum]|nr:hypothetical protein GTA08_BOTSDO11935 [Neofusicoccum parvum]
MPSSTWFAFDYNRPYEHYIIKQPYHRTPIQIDILKRELELQELFKDVLSIRQQFDTVLEVVSEDNGATVEPPRMVLEFMQKSVWHARWQRTFTRKEIKWIMKRTLSALMHIEAQGLVNIDLCMQSMLLNNHHDGSRDPSESPCLVTKLANLSHCLPPQQAVLGSPQYRAPEVHFGKPWTYPAHIWSWSIILTQLLEARADLPSRGIYASSDLHCGYSSSPNHTPYSSALLHDFALDTIPFYADLNLKRDPARMLMPRWNERLRAKGLRDDDVSFLEWLIDPNPETRPTSAQIWESGWLDFDEPGDADNLAKIQRTDIFKKVEK